MSNRIEHELHAALTRLRGHPFIRSALARRVTQEQAERWIMCAGRESRSFPDLLKGILAWSGSATLRDVIQQNLDDELGHGVEADVHFHHYLQLLDGLAIDRQHFERYSEQAGIRYALALAESLAASGRDAAVLGYMLLNESVTPVTYGAAKAAITTYYPDLRTDFFDIHISVDEDHVAALRQAVAALPPEAESEVIWGISLGERGMATLLDEAYGILDQALPRAA